MIYEWNDWFYLCFSYFIDVNYSITVSFDKFTDLFMIWSFTDLIGWSVGLVSNGFSSRWILAGVEPPSPLEVHSRYRSTALVKPCLKARSVVDQPATTREINQRTNSPTHPATRPATDQPVAINQLKFTMQPVVTTTCSGCKFSTCWSDSGDVTWVWTMVIISYKCLTSWLMDRELKFEPSQVDGG